MKYQGRVIIIERWPSASEPSVSEVDQCVLSYGLNAWRRELMSELYWHLSVVIVRVRVIIDHCEQLLMMDQSVWDWFKPK